MKASVGNKLSEYHVEASIASIHSLALRFEETQWDKLLNLYETLHELKPGPMVSFNRAIAMGYAISPEAGIHELDKINSLKDHYLYLAAMGNFYLLKGNADRAKVSFEKALVSITLVQEAELIKRKIQQCV